MRVDDYIKREDAKSAIRKRFQNLLDRVEVNSVLNEVPSADVVEREEYEQMRYMFETTVNNFGQISTTDTKDIKSTEYTMYADVVPRTTDGEFIRKEDAIKRILQQCDNDCLYCMFNWQNDSGDYCAVKECFSDIPSADVVDRKRGEWQKKEKRGAMTTHTEYHCSECQTIMGARWNYCPNCGTDMRGVE